MLVYQRVSQLILHDPDSIKARIATDHEVLPTCPKPQALHDLGFPRISQVFRISGYPLVTCYIAIENDH